jgi:O-antigen/teichoic acid export membrane protein
MSAVAPARRFGGGRLARGILFNLLGAGVPAVMGLLVLPRLVALMGTERLGILTLAWALLGYLGLLHLGVGRALAQATAAPRAELASLAWTGVAITAAAGTLAAAALFAAAPLVVRGLRLDGPLQAETLASFRILACALPFTVGSPALVGLLEARGAFGRVNLVASAVSAASYLGPLAALHAGAGLPGVVAVLAAARAAGWLAYLALCLSAVPELRRVRVARPHAGTLLRFGGWTTVSSVVSPMMVYLDRFVVGSLVSAAAVAWYGAPQEVVLRMGVVSGAVIGVLFPAFAAAADAPARLVRLLERGVESVFVLVFPLSLLLVSFAHEGLGAWLGPAVAREGAAALAWLGVGLLVNALAKPPSALVQGIGRPDLTAWLHLVELPFYAVMLFALVSGAGVRGAAIAWSVRAAVDAAGLYVLSARLVPATAAAGRRAAVLALAGLAALAVAGALPGPGPRIVWAAAALLCVGIFAMRRVLPERHRAS